MLSANEAFEQTIKKFEEVQTIDDILELDKRIKMAIEKGHFAVVSDLMSPNRAEKLGCELEEYGFSTSVQGTGMFNAETKEPMVVVHVNWRWKPPANSHIKQPESV